MKQKNNKTDSKISAPKKIPTKLIFIILYVVIIPVVVISTLFIVTYNSNKITPFDDTTTPYVNLNKIDSFTFEFYCSVYDEVKNDEDGNPITTSIKFKAAAYSKKAGITVKNLKYRVQLGSNWFGYTSNISSSISLTLAADQQAAINSSSTYYKQATISGFNQIYPKRTLLFIYKKAPTAYVNITWDETKTSTGTTVQKSYIIEYSYDQYVVDGLTQGGIS